MRLFSTFLCIASIAVAMAGCNNVDFKKTKGGMPYKLFPSKSGKKVVAGNFLKVNTITKKNDSVLITTYGSMPSYIPVTNESQPYDLSELYPQLKEGDSLYTVRLVDTFLKRAPGQLPMSFKKGDKIITTVKILKVLNNEEETKQDYDKEMVAFSQTQLKKDDKILTEYFAKNNIQPQKTPGGTYVQILTPGAGEQITNGKFLSLKYKGMTLAGKVFDTNMDNSFNRTQPMEFVLGAQPMIKGFEDGLKMLRDGAKARLFIPSSMAYANNAPPEIGPNANLIFDIEVLKVSDQPPPSNNQAPPTIDTTRR